jgi:hypothetical protein
MVYMLQDMRLNLILSVTSVCILNFSSCRTQAPNLDPEMSIEEHENYRQTGKCDHIDISVSSAQGGIDSALIRIELVSPTQGALRRREGGRKPVL